jgi:protein phosphatase
VGLIASGKTDIGLKRKTNQDAIYLNRDGHLFIVADGMGGHNGGDIASSMAVKYIPEVMLANLDKDPSELIRESISFANASIRNLSLKDEKLKGMGTTSVMLYFKGQTAYIGNVGDSRAYLINNQKLFQLSIDHSLVQEKLNMSILGGIGDYTRETAASDTHKNVIVRTVGFEDDVYADVFTYKVNRNDLLLICSDGLHGKVSDRDILTIVNNYISDPADSSEELLQKAVEHLIQQANDNGGNDNISVIIVCAK